VRTTKPVTFRYECFSCSRCSSCSVKIPAPSGCTQAYRSGSQIRMGMASSRNSGTVVAIASSARRMTTIHLARKAWKIISRIREASATPAQ
jgi:hypothetical protein